MTSSSLAIERGAQDWRHRRAVTTVTSRIRRTRSLLTSVGDLRKPM